MVIDGVEYVKKYEAKETCQRCNETAFNIRSTIEEFEGEIERSKAFMNYCARDMFKVSEIDAEGYARGFSTALEILKSNLE